jgi:hypothetical protein
MLTESNFPIDIRVRREAYKLIENGHEVSVIAIQENDQAYYEVIEGVKVYRVPKIEIFKYGKQSKSPGSSFINKLLLVSAEFTVWDRRFQDLNPNHFLYWHAIKSAYNEGYKIFDLGRTSIYNSGLMDYKKRWGTKIADLPQFCYPKELSENIADRETSTGYKLINKICKNSPESVCKMLGHICYRHLG